MPWPAPWLNYTIKLSVRRLPRYKSHLVVWPTSTGIDELYTQIGIELTCHALQFGIGPHLADHIESGPTVSSLQAHE